MIFRVYISPDLFFHLHYQQSYGKATNYLVTFLLLLINCRPTLITRQTLSIAVAHAYPLPICQRRGLSQLLKSTWLPPWLPKHTWQTINIREQDVSSIWNVYCKASSSRCLSYPTCNGSSSCPWFFFFFILLLTDWHGDTTDGSCICRWASEVINEEVRAMQEKERD